MADPSSLTLLTWPDYIAPETLDGFRVETGIRVNLEIVPSAVEMVARMRRGPAVDLLCPPEYAVRELVAESRLLPLDRRLLPLSVNLAPQFVRSRPHDPLDQFTFPKDWGTTGYLVRRDRIREPARSWGDFWELAERHSGRVTVLDSPGEVIGAALKMRGRPYNAADAESLEQAAKDLAALRPRLLALATDYKPLIKSGEAWLSLGWNGDAAALRREGVDVAYVLPEEGSQIWEDDWALDAGSPNPEGAHAFLNYLLRPDVAAQEALYTGYATPNTSAWRMLPEAVRADPSIYPSTEDTSRLEYGLPGTKEGTARREAVWRSFRG